MTSPGPLLLGVEYVMDSHNLMISLYGGAPGILNPGLLDSTLGSVRLATQYQEVTNSGLKSGAF